MWCTWGDVGTQGATLNAAHALKVANNLATLIKDCNATLVTALCQALSTPDMAVYHYLTTLDFVKDGYARGHGYPVIREKLHQD
jgi:hypothetical protein